MRLPRYARNDSIVLNILYKCFAQVLRINSRHLFSFLQLMVLIFVLNSETEKRGQAPFSTKIMDI